MSESNDVSDNVCILNIRERCPKEAEECEFKHEGPAKTSEATEEPAPATDAAAPVVAKKVIFMLNYSRLKSTQSKLSYFHEFCMESFENLNISYFWILRFSREIDRGYKVN